MEQKKTLTDAELMVFEAGQDFEALLVQSAREMGARKTRKVDTPSCQRTKMRGGHKPRFPSCSMRRLSAHVTACLLSASRPETHSPGSGSGLAWRALHHLAVFVTSKSAHEILPS